MENIVDLDALHNVTCKPMEDGYHYNHAIAETFGDCLYVWREYLAFFAGWSSTCFWVACQAPQLIQNCKRKSVAAISVWFLLQWLLGDILNLFASFLTRQITTVKAVAVTFVVLDLIVCTQYIFFRFFGPNGSCGKKDKPDQLLTDNLLDPDEDYMVPNSPSNNSDAESYQPPDASEARDNEPVHGFILPVLVGLQVFASLSVGYHTYQTANQEQYASVPRHTAHVWERRPLGLDLTTHGVTEAPLGFNWFKFMQLENEKSYFWIGWIIGWISACIYLSSRLPQVLKNFKRGSVEGLSPIMFMCTVMGNLTYGGSILLRARKLRDISQALPFLVGSLGTLFFDATILTQFAFYRKKKPKRKLHLKGKKNPNEVPRSLHGIVDWSLTPFVGDGNTNDTPNSTPIITAPSDKASKDLYPTV